MASTTALKLESLLLSAAELKDKTDWDDTIIREWLNFIRNLVLLADLVDIEINQKLEEVPTDFLNGSIPYVFDNLLREENNNLFWDSIVKALEIGGDIELAGDLLGGGDASFAFDLFAGGNAHIVGDIKGKNRAKQYFFAGF